MIELVFPQNQPDLFADSPVVFSYITNKTLWDQLKNVTPDLFTSQNNPCLDLKQLCCASALKIFLD